MRVKKKVSREIHAAIAIENKDSLKRLSKMYYVYKQLVGAGFEPAKLMQKIYSLPPLATWIPPHYFLFYRNGALGTEGLEPARQRH